MKTKRLLLFLLILSVLISSFAFPVIARADDADESIKINVPFVSVGEVINWDFPYSDDYFRQDPATFNLELAQASMGLTISAFRNNGKYLDDQYETYLKAAGFTGISPFGYDKPTGLDTLSGVVAYKKIDDFILIAAVPCGQGYGNEWAGNLEVGEGIRHAGFSRGAKILEDQIDGFIEKNGLTGKLKLWLSGFSRAAAVANLTAADCYESGRFESIYATQFGVPRTSKEACYIPGIFNICGKYDPVPQIPIQSWGFERYGVDYYTPSEESDVMFLKYFFAAHDVTEQLRGWQIWNNPEINHQLHMIIEFLAEMFPTSEDYAREFQDTLMSIWTQANADRMFFILSEAISQMEKMDSRAAYSSDVFIDYLSYISSQHLKEEQSQVKSQRWNPEAGLVDNLMLEHMPYIYISWLFSGVDAAELFGGPIQTRRVVIDADADIEVYHNGNLITGINREGWYYSLLTEADEAQWEEFEKMDDDDFTTLILSNICFIKTGRSTVLYLPMNTEFEVVFRTYGVENISYFDVFFDVRKTFGTCSKLHMFVASAGTYAVDFVYDEPVSDVMTLRGHATHVRQVDFPYSVTVMMAEESYSYDYISLRTLLQIIFYALGFALLVVIVCVVVAILHHRGKKKGKKDRYSPMYTVIPGLILIAEFSLLTQFFTVNMFSIGMARSVFAGLTMLTMLIIALHGLIRSRNAWNIVITLLMAALVPLNFFGYQRSAAVTSSLRHFLLYYLGVLLFTMLAISTLYVPKATKPEIRKVLSCIACGMAVSSAVFSEVGFCLANDDSLLRTICRIAAAVFTIAFAFLRRRFKEWGFIWIFAAVIIGGIADVFIGFSFIAGVALFAACHICLVIAFLNRKKLSVKQWIIWAVISAADVALILILGRKMGVYAYGAAAYAPVLVLMVVSSFNVDRMINLTAGIFFVSDLLLALYQWKHLHISIHIIYMALFYAAMILFAGVRTKLTEEKAVCTGGLNDE